MRAYVLGAGASHPIYPLGGELFNEIDKYILGRGPYFNRFDYQKDWPPLKDLLKCSSNPLLRQAYGNGNIEQIFTVLDLAENLFSNSQISMLKKSVEGTAEAEAAVANHRFFASGIKEYRDVRSKLLWAMEDYFLHRNQLDLESYGSAQWKDLKRFGTFLQSGDVVITFNYDSTVERVLLDQKKWAPSDGYGTEIVFQKNQDDKTRVGYSPSMVKVLHLHGAIGWYSKPPFSPDFHPRAEGGGAIPREALSPAPLETEIALDPLLLQGLGIQYVDASLPRRPPQESQILLHPSFLKEYEAEDRPSQVFNRLWKMASDALRNADEVTIIGYSLPPADSAAWTLLHTSCDRKHTTVVNPSKSVLRNRYGRLLKHWLSAQAMDFGTWLNSLGIPSVS